MISLMKKVLEPPITYQDKIMYMTSLGLNHSIGSDKNANNPTCVDQILNMIASSKTRYTGLQLLELSLQQNFENIYNKGRWVWITYNIIKDSRAANLEKMQVCKILSMMIPHMIEDSSFDSAKEEFIKDIFPLLLQKISEQVEWAEEAAVCIKMALKTFPKELSYYQGPLLSTILSQVSSNVSSKFFEILSECFCELPYCNKDNVENVQNRWKELYLRTLKTIEGIQIACLSRMSGSGPYDKLGIDLSEFIFKEEQDDSNLLPAIVKRVRRFVNLCKCLAKMLSVKSRYPMPVPSNYTVRCLIPLYTDNKKDKVNSHDEEILCSFIAQMRLAGLVVLESLILNCNLLKETVIMKDLLRMAILSSNANVSSEHVSELRIASWKLISLWLDGFGCNVSKEIAIEFDVIEEILNDINIEATESFQANDITQVHSKSKKNTSSHSNRKSILNRKNQQRVCEAALNSLESLLYTGASNIPKRIFQEICKRVFKICDAIHSSCDPIPFPYNDETCREKLYSVVLTIAVVLKPDDFQILQTAMKILGHINNDSSFKVKKLGNKVPIITRLLLYPKRPLPPSPCSDHKQRRPNVSNEALSYSEWSSVEYEHNIKESVSETSENVSINVEQSFQNENEIENSEEYMDIEPQYHEQVIENQCNGEDLLEIQTSSQSQDDIESDEEEEEEDEERSYGDEEMNQEEHLQEMYIPASRKSPLPVQIAAETVQSITEPEYEELTSCNKAEENSLNNSKDKCVNGDDNVICDEEVPSSSTQVRNENGIFGLDDDEDLDEENEEEEEEENESLPAEKRTEGHDSAPKRQKIEAKDDEDVVDERIEKVRSPTMDEMKSDFLKLFPSSTEEVKSGKAQMSTS